MTLPKTGFFAENEDLRPSDNQGILKIGVSQSLEWPGIYTARRQVLERQVQSSLYARDLRALELRRSLQQAYYTLWYQQSRQALWQRLDSLYTTLAKAAVLRVRTGESAGLDSISPKAKAAEINLQLRTLQADIQSQQGILQSLLNTDSLYLADTGLLQKIALPLNSSDLANHPVLLAQQQGIAAANAEVKVARRSVLPDFSGRFFSQRLYGLPNPYSGFSVSVGVPLFSLRGYRAKVNAAKLETDYQQSVFNYQERVLNASLQQAEREVDKQSEILNYYETIGLGQAEAIIKASNLSYRAGEISFAELSNFLTQAIDIQKNHLDALHQYNQAAIELEYYLTR